MLKKRYYIGGGIFFIALFIFNVYVHSQSNNYEQILWFCSFTTLLLAIALITRNNFLASTIVTAALVLETLWVIDVTSLLLFGHLALGTAGYITTVPTIRFFLTFYHFLLWIVPVFIVLDMERFHKYSWLGAIGFFSLISVVTLLLTDMNVNCVQSPCIFGFYEFLRPVVEALGNYLPLFIVNLLVLSIVVFIPTHFLFRWIVRKMK